MSYSYLTQGQYSYFMFDRKRIVSGGGESSILSLNPVGKRVVSFFCYYGHGPFEAYPKNY